MKLLLPSNVTFTGTTSDTLTVLGNEIVVTVGRLAAGSEQNISIDTVASDGHGNHSAEAFAVVTSSTALPFFSNPVATRIRH